nr:dihydrofolate reductase family protein [Streptomyces sp. SID13031]
MGGGETCQEFLTTGLADVIRLHVAPVVLGSGTRLFPAGASPRIDLQLTEAVNTPAAQHLTYRVVK